MIPPEPCPYLAKLHLLSTTLAGGIAEALPMLFNELEHPVEGNPFGFVLTVYCSECNCAHVSVFAPSPEKPAFLRASQALQTASTRIRTQHPEVNHHYVQNSKKADN